MVRIESFKITFEILQLISEIDEFKGAWIALGNLSPDTLLQLRKVAWCLVHLDLIYTPLVKKRLPTRSRFFYAKYRGGRFIVKFNTNIKMRKRFKGLFKIKALILHNLLDNFRLKYH